MAARTPPVSISASLCFKTQPGIAERFIKDLEDGVQFAKNPPYEISKTGFLYGMGASMDGREMIRLGLRAYIDSGYEYE